MTETMTQEYAEFLKTAGKLFTLTPKQRDKVVTALEAAIKNEQDYNEALHTIVRMERGESKYIPIEKQEWAVERWEQAIAETPQDVTDFDREFTADVKNVLAENKKALHC